MSEENDEQLRKGVKNFLQTLSTPDGTVVSDEQGEEESQEDNVKNVAVEILETHIQNWVARIRSDQNISSLQNLLLSFYSVARSDMKGSAPHPYRVTSPSLQLKVILLSLKYFSVIFSKKENLEDENLDLYVNSLLKSLVLLVQHKKKKFSKEMGDILTYCLPLLQYFQNNLDLSKLLLNELLTLLVNREETVRNKSFILIYRMASTFPDPFLQYVLKGIYFLFVNSCGYYQPKNFQIVDFLNKAVLEVYSINYKESYQNVFSFVKELCVLLKKAMTNFTYSYVYSWKFFLSISLWTKLICRFSKKNVEFRKLVLPMTQLILGVIKLKSQSLQYLPLRLKLVSLLNDMASSTGTFIPSSSFLMELFLIDKLVVSGKGLLKKPINYEFILKFGEKQILTKDFQKFIFEEISFLIVEFLSINSRNVAFPEFVSPMLKRLKKLYKKDKRDISHFLKFKLKRIIELINQNNKFVVKCRKSLRLGEKMVVKEKTPLEIECGKLKRDRATQKLNRLNRFVQKPVVQKKPEKRKRVEPQEKRKKRKLTKKKRKKKKKQKKAGDEVDVLQLDSFFD